MDTTPTPHSKDSLPPVVTSSDAQQQNANSQPSYNNGRRGPNRRVIATILLASIFGLVSGFAGAEISSLTANNDQLSSRLTSGTDGNKIVTQEEENLSSVVSKVSPSVVSIITQSRTTDFYLGSSTQEGAGTGIIVSKDGYVMTNKHVINGANTVGIALSDGTTYENVQVLGVDPLNDVAILKIPNVSNLPAAELGDSTSVRVGQKVVAIGNSLGQYQNTVTSGIISGTGRPVSAQAGDAVETLTDLIQTDAAINPGNSGGPLLNLQGQVIGINTAIAADAQGIGFSIPIGATKGILKGVLAGKGVQRAYLGINYVPITANVADFYKLSVKKGAYVFNGGGKTAIADGSPAAKAGIKDKDIITKVGDIEVGDRGSVSSLVAEYAPDDTIKLTLIREGKTMTIDARLVAFKS
ncbi:MAG: putative HtrA2 peptidase [Candidatus Saccharibacteria bacterium]|jgi:S1-C subfamily serine protease|nr:putative HtrA2 peptidase [Candidatus Saccharibacteria bacterium]